MFLRFLILSAGITLATCVIQEITLYSEPDFEGDSVGFKSKHASFGPDFESFVQSAQSYCATGWWRGFDSENFVGTLTFGSTFTTTRYCENGTFPGVKSLRYFGPLNTSTLSISLYKGIPGNHLGGEEVIITTPAGSNFGFVPTGAVVTGPSSWTLFPNPDFSGEGICLMGTLEMNSFSLNSTISPGSVLRGCNPRKVSSYITLTE